MFGEWLPLAPTGVSQKGANHSSEADNHSCPRSRVGTPIRRIQNFQLIKQWEPFKYCTGEKVKREIFINSLSAAGDVYVFDYSLLFSFPRWSMGTRGKKGRSD